jgi:anti-anti-sigma regulatory factor
VTAVHHRARNVAGDTIVIASPGDDDLADRVRMSLDLGARHVVVDLGDGRRVDASTLSSLKRLAGRLGAKGGGLSVVCSQPNLRRILDVTLLSRSFGVFGTLDAALRRAGP